MTGLMSVVLLKMFSSKANLGSNKKPISRQTNGLLTLDDFYLILNFLTIEL